MWDLGVLGTIAIVNVKKSVGLKLRTVILLHVGLAFFRFHVGKNPNTLHGDGVRSGLADVTITPRTNFYLLKHQETLNE